jgi:hypothetical protein
MARRSTENDAVERRPATGILARSREVRECSSGLAPVADPGPEAFLKILRALSVNHSQV